MDVTLEDQERINTFSRLNTRMHDLSARISAHKAAAEDCEEAGNELMLMDDEEVPYVIGECFVHLHKDEAEERLQIAQDEAASEQTQLQAERTNVQSQMAELKQVLYGKFGNAINLDE